MGLWFHLLAQTAVIAVALVGGVFLAFSDFIMRSLAKTDGVGGVEAMQVINREVFRWVFMTLFMGLAPLSVFIAAYGWMGVGGNAGALFAAAGLTYFIGCFGVTVCFNVPLNEALAKMDLAEGETRAFWSGTYVPRWTLWNSVRGIACVVSAMLMLAGLLEAVKVMGL